LYPVLVREKAERCERFPVLTLTFLGVGSAFARRNYHSSALLESWSIGPEQQFAPDDLLLIDYGGTGPLALFALGRCEGFAYLRADGRIRYEVVPRVLVTHLHADHVGGLEEFAIVRRYFSQQTPESQESRPQLLSAPRVLHDLWHHTLHGGLSVIDGRHAVLEDYFEPRPIRPYIPAEESFDSTSRAVIQESSRNPLIEEGKDGSTESIRLLDRYEVSIYPTDHIRIQKKYDWPSYGLRLKDLRTGETALYSGDTRMDPEMMDEMMRTASIIFQDAQLEEQIRPVHALLRELRSLPPEIRRKMHLYHYGDTWDDPRHAVAGREFIGFAEPQKRYLVFR